MEYIKILFNIKDLSADHDELVELIWEYLSCLYINGQINEGYELIEREQQFIAFVTVQGSDALQEMYDNIYIKENRAKLEGILEISYEFVGINVDSTGQCTCEKPSWYILKAEYSSTESPLICGDCGMKFPLYKVPHILNEDEHYRIISWQRAYRCVDRLWMENLADRFTFRQLSQPNSALFKGAMEIRKELEEKLNAPVYYYVFHANKLMEVCPCCGLKWTANEDENIVDFKCEKCRLATDK